MAEQAQQESVAQEAADPYGDVALGVECAWPQTLPAVVEALSDASISIRFQL